MKLLVENNSLNSHSRIIDKTNCTSKYIGVRKHKDRPNWICNIVPPKQQQISHTFKIEEHAAYYYDVLAIKYYGDDANINGIEEPDDFKKPEDKEPITYLKLGENRYKVFMGKKTKVVNSENEAKQLYNNYKISLKKNKELKEQKKKKKF